MNKKPVLGLRGRLIAVLLFVFAALAGLVLWQSLAQREVLVQAASERLSHRVRLIAARQQSLVERGDAVLNSLMSMPALRGMGRPSCERVLAERLKAESAFFQIGQVTPNGDVRCTAVPGRQGVSFADRDWFRQAVRTRETSVGNLVVGRVLGKPVITLGKAMRNPAGEVQAVYYLSLGLDWLRQELLKSGLPDGVRLLVIDGQGELVMRHPDREGWADRNFLDHPLVQRILTGEGDGLASVAGLDGAPRLLAYTPLLQSAAGNRYYLGLSLPVAAVEAPAQRQLLVSLAIALSLLAGTLALVYWGGERWVVRPLRTLAQAARRYGTGDFAARNDLPRKHDEIGELAGALADMAAALRESTVSRQRLQVEIEEHRRAEQCLQRSQTLLDHATGIARLGAWSVELHTLDPEDFGRNPVVWSEEMYRQLGYTPEEVPLPGTDLFFARVHPDDRQPLWETAIQALAGKRPWQAEYRLVQPAGDVRLVAESGEFLFDENGKPTSMHGTVQDITERRQAAARLRDSETHLRLALEGAGAGSLEWNLDSGQDYWSDELWALFGLEANSAPPCYATWRGIVHPDDLERVERIVGAAVAEGREFDVEWRVETPPGTPPRWLMSRAQPARDETGRITRYFGISIDISARKEAELALAHYRDRLETMVAERTAELSAANKELEGFTYAASHDMKGPLGRINSFCALLGQKFRDRLEGDGLMFLDLIQQNALRLHVLVEDLLAHAQVGQQPLAIQDVDVTALVRAILHERAQPIEQCGAEVRLGLPGHLLMPGHPFSLGQILRNLVDNALKYSSQAQPPVVEIGGGIEDGLCRLWVRDNGIGIDAAYQERIFEIFRRLHTYAEYPGNGVGLALVKKAMERMGGRVRVDSEPGQGAAFFLEWPARAAGGPA